MIVANVRIDGVRAVPSERMPITAGMIGAQVRIAYTDPVWDGLRKTVVFHGCVTKDVVSDGDVITIPPEVIARPDVRLHIGVYGIDGGGVLTSARFLIDVYDSVFFDGEDVPAGDEETVLEKVLRDIEDLKKDKVPFDSENKRAFCIGMDDCGLYITMEGV